MIRPLTYFSNWCAAVRYKKELSKRKKKLIKYIKREYVEYGGETAFLAINRILLDNYLEYYSVADLFQCKESREKVIQQLKEVMTIGDRLAADAYDDEAMLWLYEHNKTLCLLYNPKTDETVVVGESSMVQKKYLFDNYIKEHPETASWLRGTKSVWDSNNNSIIWKQLTADAERARTKDYKDFFSHIADNFRNWWD